MEQGAIRTHRCLIDGDVGPDPRLEPDPAPWGGKLAAWHHNIITLLLLIPYYCFISSRDVYLDSDSDLDPPELTKNQKYSLYSIWNYCSDTTTNILEQNLIWCGSSSGVVIRCCAPLEWNTEYNTSLIMIIDGLHYYTIHRMVEQSHSLLWR